MALQSLPRLTGGGTQIYGAQDHSAHISSWLCSDLYMTASSQAVILLEMCQAWVQLFSTTSCMPLSIKMKLQAQFKTNIIY